MVSHLTSVFTEVDEVVEVSRPKVVHLTKSTVDRAQCVKVPVLSGTEDARTVRDVGYCQHDVDQIYTGKWFL